MLRKGSSGSNSIQNDDNSITSSNSLYFTTSSTDSTAGRSTVRSTARSTGSMSNIESVSTVDSMITVGHNNLSSHSQGSKRNPGGSDGVVHRKFKTGSCPTPKNNIGVSSTDKDFSTVDIIGQMKATYEQYAPNIGDRAPNLKQLPQLVRRLTLSNTNRLLILVLVLLVILLCSLPSHSSGYDGPLVRYHHREPSSFSDSNNILEDDMASYKKTYASWENRKYQNGETSQTDNSDLSYRKESSHTYPKVKIEDKRDESEIDGKPKLGILEPPPSTEVGQTARSPLSEEIEDISSDNTRGFYTDPVPSSYSTNDDIEEVTSATLAYADPSPIDKNAEKPEVIAYVLPVDSCPDTAAPMAEIELLEERDRIDPDVELRHTAFMDAAAVLKHAVHRASVHNSLSRSKYDYEMIAIIHEDANECPSELSTSSSFQTREEQLQALGYRTIIRKTPVEVDDIKGEYLRHNIRKSGKTEERDLIRLYAFALLQYKAVVLLDLRSLVLQPLDELFDLLLIENPTSSNVKEGLSRIDLAPYSKGAAINPPSRINAFYTRDYSSVSPQRRQYGIHPGLVVLRPSREAFEQLVMILREGDYRYSTGWEGKGYGNFLGAMTTKGLLAHYFDNISESSTNIELNRCVYNSMADSPYIRVDGQIMCRNHLHTGQHPHLEGSSSISSAVLEDECEDCRSRKLNELRTVNMSVCRDPWTCFVHPEGAEKLRLCRSMNAVWYRLRMELEDNWTKFGPPTGTHYAPAEKVNDGLSPEHYLGYCRTNGRNGYVPMAPPVSNRRLRNIRARKSEMISTPFY